MHLKFNLLASISTFFTRIEIKYQMFANVREKIIYHSVPCIHNVYKKPELYNRTSILIQEDAFTSVCIKTSFTPFFVEF